MIISLFLGAGAQFSVLGRVFYRIIPIKACFSWLSDVFWRSYKTSIMYFTGLSDKNRLGAQINRLL